MVRQLALPDAIRAVQEAATPDGGSDHYLVRAEAEPLERAVARITSQMRRTLKHPETYTAVELRHGEHRNTIHATFKSEEERLPDYHVSVKTMPDHQRREYRLEDGGFEEQRATHTHVNLHAFSQAYFQQAYDQ